MKLVWALGAVFFIVALPLALISSNLRYLVNDPNTYASGFDKYGIVEVTGLSRQELLKGAAGLRDYFNSDKEPIDVTVQKQGQTIPLFQGREVQHLKDVKDLFRLFYRIQVISIAYIIGFVAVAAVVRRRGAAKYLAKVVIGSVLFTLGVVAVLGLWGAIDFDGLFLQFHLLIFSTFFSNDFWMLDPQHDYLIMMFPEGFWYDNLVKMVYMTVGEMILLSVISGVYLVGERRKWGLRVRSARQ